MNDLNEAMAGAAHQINNHLAAIMGFAQLALRRDPEPVLRGYLQTMLYEAQKASGIIVSLQSLTRECKATENPTDAVDNAMVSMEPGATLLLSGDADSAV